MRKLEAKACLVAIVLAGWLLSGCSSRNTSTNTPPSPASASVPDNRADTDSAQEATPAGPRRSRPAVIFVEFVTTPHDVVDRMLELARVGPNDVVYDLGCGDGRIVVAAAKKYGCRAVGFELDRLRVKEARANALASDVADRVTIELRDALLVDLRPATVVTLYLGTELNARLVPQLQQMAPGSRIVSHDFGIEGFPADTTIRMTSREDKRDHLIHLWTCPLQPTP